MIDTVGAGSPSSHPHPKPKPIGIFLSFLASLFLQSITVFADDSSNSKNGTKADSHDKSSKSAGSMVIIAVLGAVTIFGLCFLLYKLWQKKKREEQYARLLKLFEEDDELEVELGLRD